MDIDLTSLNKTELLELIRQQTGNRVSRQLSTPHLLDIINTGTITEKANTEQTRKRLQVFINDNWEYYQTNLPCRGQFNEGKCSIYKCSEGQHIDCYLNVKDQIESKS